jgi:hypothetical protein
MAHHNVCFIHDSLYSPVNIGHFVVCASYMTVQFAHCTSWSTVHIEPFYTVQFIRHIKISNSDMVESTYNLCVCVDCGSEILSDSCFTNSVYSNDCHWSWQWLMCPMQFQPSWFTWTFVVPSSVKQACRTWGRRPHVTLLNSFGGSRILKKKLTHIYY